MLVPPADAWKLVLAVALGGAILASAYAKAPRRAFPGSDLRRLVLAALLLYAVGAVASLTHHAILPAVVYVHRDRGVGAGRVALPRQRSGRPPARAAMSRSTSSRRPIRTGCRGSTGAQFERDFEDYARRRREPASAAR